MAYSPTAAGPLLTLPEYICGVGGENDSVGGCDEG